MVAAWISAETGVGPAIASGNQTCSGNWADLPIVPPNSKSAAADTKATEAPPPEMISEIFGMLEVVNPVMNTSTKIPNMNGTSPILVVMKALIAELELTWSSHQCPISRYEQTPMTSQPTRSWNRLLARTTTSIALVNSEITT